MAQRLERENVVHLEKQLWQWQTPETMDQDVGAVESATFFNQSGLAFLRDASIAAEFGKARGAEKVRLVSDRWPDFELVIDGRIEQFEAVEADKPGRRRGKEYRDATTVVVDDPVEEWIACAEQAPAWITAACEKKKAKRYTAGAKLVVYLNLSEFGIRQKEVESCFAVATVPIKDDFNEVWVLWKSKAYPVWRDGVQQTLIPGSCSASPGTST